MTSQPFLLMTTENTKFLVGAVHQLWSVEGLQLFVNFLPRQSYAGVSKFSAQISMAVTYASLVLMTRPQSTICHLRICVALPVGPRQSVLHITLEIDETVKRPEEREKGQETNQEMDIIRSYIQSGHFQTQSTERNSTFLKNMIGKMNRGTSLE